MEKLKNRKLKRVFNYLGIFLRVVEYLGIAFLLFIIFIAFSSRLNMPGGYQSLVVLSGSMEPAIKTGSVVVVQPKDTYQVGDIVTINREMGNVNQVTHRIVGIEGDQVITQGDANNAPDNWSTQVDDIAGKVLVSVPYLGYAVNFSKTTPGFLLMVIVPAMLIILAEILEIKNELEKNSTKSYKDGLKQLEKWAASKQTFVLLCLFGFSAFVFATGATVSLFTDTEVATAYISVGTWEDDNPATPKIVINEVYYNVVDDDEFCSEDKNEWVELYNASEEEVSLKKWKLVDAEHNEKVINKEVTLGPDRFIILSHDQSTWTQCWDLPDGVDTIQWTGSGEWLDNDGDTLTLFNADGEEVDYVAWGGGEFGWEISVEQGYSIARKEAGEDTDQETDWESCSNPSPGTGSED